MVPYLPFRILGVLCVSVCAVRVASVAVPLPPLRVRHEARRDETTCKKKICKCVHPSVCSIKAVACMNLIPCVLSTLRTARRELSARQTHLALWCAPPALLAQASPRGKPARAPRITQSSRQGRAYKTHALRESRTSRAAMACDTRLGITRTRPHTCSARPSEVACAVLALLRIRSCELCTHGK